MNSANLASLILIGSGARGLPGSVAVDAGAQLGDRHGALREDQRRDGPE